VIAFAHAGHWLASLLYLVPIVALGAWLALAGWRERRRAGAQPERRVSDRSAPRR